MAFEVKDTGIGIPEDKLETLFDAFEQADISTTRQYGGTGLGLAISHRLCQMMGGDMTVTSQLGEGTTFTVHLPAMVTKFQSVDNQPTVPAKSHIALVN